MTAWEFCDADETFQIELLLKPLIIDMNLEDGGYWAEIRILEFVKEYFFGMNVYIPSGPLFKTYLFLCFAVLPKFVHFRIIQIV